MNEPREEEEIRKRWTGPLSREEYMEGDTLARDNIYYIFKRLDEARFLLEAEKSVHNSDNRYLIARAEKAEEERDIAFRRAARFATKKEKQLKYLRHVQEITRGLYLKCDHLSELLDRAQAERNQYRLENEKLKAAYARLVDRISLATPQSLMAVTEKDILNDETPEPSKPGRFDE